VGIAPGTYTSVTVDAKGRVTAGYAGSGPILPATCTTGDRFSLTTQQRITNSNYYAGLYECVTANFWSIGGLINNNKGTWWPLGVPQSTSNQAPVTAAGTVRYSEVVLPFTLSFTKIIINVQSTDTGKTIGAAVYDSDCNLITDTVTTGGSVGAVGRVVLSFNQTILGPGVYYIALAADSAVASVTTIGSFFPTNWQDALSTPRVFDGSSAATISGGTITWPASCGTKTQKTGVLLPITWFLP
jgi:hypothetical protein